jgi:hypothetical protein
MDFHELNSMTVAQLREVAAGIDGITGYTQMRKDRLLRVICGELHIDMHEHHDVVGLDKATIKEQIRQLKLQRAEALSSGDGTQLKRIRRRIHQLKRTIRRATV